MAPSRPSRPKALLGLGTATLIPNYGLGERLAVAPGKRLLQRVVEAGIGYIDTAPAYENAESIIGELWPSLEPKAIRICTKVAGCSAPENLKSSVESSMKRLQCAAVDTLLIHSATEQSLSMDPTIQFLKSAKQMGIARHVGASTYGEKCAEMALRAEWCDVVQIEFSILNQSVLRNISKYKSGEEIVVRSVLCKGLLSSRRNAMSDLSKEVADSINELDRLAETWGFALPELAIRFALDTPTVDIVLVGMASEAELNVAIRAASLGPLDENQLEVLATFDRSSYDCVHPERWA